jgi:ABC-type dipeptide/oligopeptide/nickel transport system permease component
MGIFLCMVNHGRSSFANRDGALMSSIRAANQTPILVGAATLLVEASEFIYSLRNKMTDEDQQHYVRWAHALSNWQKAIANLDKGQNVEG